MGGDGLHYQASKSIERGRRVHHEFRSRLEARVTGFLWNTWPFLAVNRVKLIVREPPPNKRLQRTRHERVLFSDPSKGVRRFAELAIKSIQP